MKSNSSDQVSRDKALKEIQRSLESAGIPSEKTSYLEKRAAENHWYDEPDEEDFNANGIFRDEKPRIKLKRMVPALNTISLSDLKNMNLPPQKWIVHDILPTGLTILVAPPKIGKSWMGFDLAINVARGTPFLSHSTNQCGVLYLALEDSFNRLQNRMLKILQDNPVPANCYLATQAPGLNDGLIDVLEDHLVKYPDIEVVIFDTFQKVRGISSKNEGSYASDYREIAALKKFADDHDICVLVIHHTRKQRDDSDPFNNISGTTGIMGAADTIWMISKENRSADEATLSITGRDVLQDELTIQFDQDSYRWQLLGRTEDIAIEREQEEYEADPINKTIRRLVNQTPKKCWRGTMKSLLTEIKTVSQTEVDINNERQLTDKVKAREAQLFKYDGIRHEKESRGSGGAPHIFWIDGESTEEDSQLTIEQV